MKPRILFLDIETAPDVVWTWGVYQANAIAVKENWYILSFAAKWAGEKQVICKGLIDYPGYGGGDSTEDLLLEDVWTLLDEADIVVAHNGASFDIKKINARLIDNDFAPYSPVKVVDTKRDLKKVAVFSSNRLNWLVKQFKIGSKTMEHQDFQMWQGCMTGNPASWKQMKAYNRHDVVLLEKLYDKIANWIPQPDYRNGDLMKCANPACGSKDIIRKGRVLAYTRIYQSYQCNECGARFRGKKAE